MLFLIVVPMIGGPPVRVFEDRSPARVCVNLQGSTTTTSQTIEVTFTPVAKSGAAAQATRELNVKDSNNNYRHFTDICSECGFQHNGENCTDCTGFVRTSMH